MQYLTDNAAWRNLPVQFQRKAAMKFVRNRVPRRTIRHLGKAWMGGDAHGQRKLITALRAGLKNPETRFETDALVMGQIEANFNIETVLLHKTDKGRDVARVTVSCVCGRSWHFELPAAYNQTNGMQIVLKVHPHVIYVDPGSLTVRMMIIAENARGESNGQSLMEIYYGTEDSWKTPGGHSHVMGAIHHNFQSKRSATDWTCGKTRRRDGA